MYQSKINQTRSPVLPTPTYPYYLHPRLIKIFEINSLIFIISIRSLVIHSAYTIRRWRSINLKSARIWRSIFLYTIHVYISRCIFFLFSLFLNKKKIKCHCHCSDCTRTRFLSYSCRYKEIHLAKILSLLLSTFATICNARVTKGKSI